MNNTAQQIDNFQSDIDAIQSIAVVPTILDLICKTTGMGFAAIARVTEERWITCGVKDNILFGLQPGDELEVESTICHEVRLASKTIVIDHVSEDEIYNNHHTPLRYGFQSYISVPIFRKNGHFFGTLCAIDPKPHKLNNPETIEMFKLYCDLIAYHLETVERMQTSELDLTEERHIAELRDQFIAILGHDLRNPLGAITNSLHLLERLTLEERAKQLIDITKKSSFRIKEIVDNILDFARGKLGGGLVIDRDSPGSLETTLNQVTSELKAIWPNRAIIVESNCAAEISCDWNRMAQVMSNLMSNAINHGSQDTPIVVTANCDEVSMTLSIVNNGKRISQPAMDRMFKPFSRGEVNPGQHGLGLGLYISDEIIKAHGGTINVESTDHETRFTLFIPQSATVSN